MKKIISSFLICGLILSSNLFSTKAYGAEYYDNVLSKNFIFGSDYKESSVISSESIYFDISKMWDVQDAYLNLIFTQSELLIDDISTLTVYINDVPISSTKLNGKFKYKETWKVPIPKDVLKEGVNQVTIKSARRISDLPCTDDSNPANWIVYSKDSFVHVDFKELNSPATLQYYPYPYLKSSDTKGNFKVCLPDNYNSDEATAAMYVGSSLGTLKKSDELHGSISTFSEINGGSNDDLIFIGTKGNTPKEFMSLLSGEEEKRLDNEAIIKQVISPYNKEKRLLLVISNNPKLLTKATRALGNESIIKEEPNNVMFISEDMKVVTSESNNGVQMTFESLGYDNAFMEGPFKQTMNLSVDVPKNRVLNDQASIITKVKYSKNLDFNKSLLTVLVNGVPAGSKKLSADNADNDSLEVKIPKEVRDDSALNVQVRFDLEMNDEYCDFTEQQTPWAFVSKDSYLNLSFTDRTDYDLKYLPYPFIKNNSINNTVIVVPDKPYLDYLDMGLDISSYIGRNINGNSGEIQVVKYSDLTDDLKKKNLILIGTPEENPLIKEVNKSLPIKFNGDFTSFEGNDKLNINPDYAKEVSSIQLCKSTFNNDSGVMVITAPNAKSLAYAEEYLNDEALINKLEGKAVLIDQKGNTTFLKDENNKVQQEEVNKKQILSTQGKVLLGFVAVIGILLIVSVITIRKKYKKNK